MPKLTTTQNPADNERVKKIQTAARAKNVSLLPILIILVLVGISGFLLYQNMRLEKRITELQTILHTVPTFPSSVTSRHEDWKVYANQKLGVTLFHPANISIQETPQKTIIGNSMYLYILSGSQEKYVGCALTQNCPTASALNINGKAAFKNTGTSHSLGGPHLLEYRFPGINPQNPTISSKNIYSLYFEYHGDPQDTASIDTFNEIANTIQYSFGETWTIGPNQ